MTEEREMVNQERGKRVSAARKKAGLTQAALAEKVPCHVNLISMIEQGRRGLTIETANRISEICGVDVESLLFLPPRATSFWDDWYNTAKALDACRQRYFEMLLESHGYSVAWDQDCDNRLVRCDKCAIKGKRKKSVEVDIKAELYPMFLKYEDHFMLDIQRMIENASLPKEGE